MTCPLFTLPSLSGGAERGPARGLTRTSAARLRTGGEEESPRTGDSNPGCNCLVRGYSPSMHFFWGGDMPRYSPPLPSGGAERGPVRAAQPAGPPARGSRTCALAGVPRARALAPTHPFLCSPFSVVFQFLDRYISLARKIGYVTIKPMTNTARYLCFSWLMCNRREKAAWPAIRCCDSRKIGPVVMCKNDKISVLP